MKRPELKNNIGKTVFPIGAWSCIGVDDETDAIDDWHFSLIKDAGINFLVDGHAYDTDAGKRFAEMCGKYSIGHFIIDEGISSVTGEEPQEYVDKVVSNAIKAFSHEKCYLGPFFGDEPNRKGFLRLEKLYSAFLKTGAEGLPYVNLLPAVKEGPLDTDPGYSYEQYLEEYIAIAKPEFLSFDCYLFGTGLKGQVAINGNDSFESFSRISAASKKYGIPFWSFVSCGGQWESPVVEEDIYPDKAQFDLSVHISLAFGAKGIEYFTFRQPKIFYDTAKADCVNGMVGYTGRINKWYYYAKEISGYLSKYADIFLNAEHEGVLFIGGSYSYPAFGGAVINGVGYKELDYSESDHAIIGIFTLGTKRLLYVVNNSFSESAYVGLRFDKNYDHTILDASGKRKPTAYETRKDKCLLIENIQKGEAVMIEYELK